MLRGGNAREVVQAVKAKIDDIHAKHIHPGGLRMVPFYDRMELVEAALHTVYKALIEGIIFVVIVLYFYLGNIRSALAVTTVLVVAPLGTFIVMRYYELSANLMSLGGLAISLGMITDAAIIQVENVSRHLSEASEEDRGSVSREQLQRRIYIGFNTYGRDIESIVAEAQAKIGKLKLPPNYEIVWGGSFENMQRPMARLKIIVPITMGIMFLLLYVSFNSFPVCAVGHAQPSLAADRRHRRTVGDRRVSQRARLSGFHQLVRDRRAQRHRAGVLYRTHKTGHGLREGSGCPRLYVETTACSHDCDRRTARVDAARLGHGRGLGGATSPCRGGNRWSLDLDRLDTPGPSHPLSVVRT